MSLFQKVYSIFYYNLDTLVYFLLSIYLVLYVATTFTIIQLPIHPTVNRITYFDVVFKWSLTGSIAYDIAFTMSILSAAILLKFRRRFSLIFSSLFLSTAVVATYTNHLQISIAVFLITLPLLALAILAKNRPWQKLFYKVDQVSIRSTSHNFKLMDLVFVLLLILVSLESISFLRWVIHPFSVDVYENELLVHINTLTSGLFYAFGIMSPVLVILSMTSFLFRKFLITLTRKMEIKFNNLFEGNCEKENTANERRISTINFKLNRFVNTRVGTVAVIVLISIIPSAAISVYPYAVSPDIRPLGTDVPIYAGWFNDYLLSAQKDLSSFLYELFIHVGGGSRPLTFATIYIVMNASGTTLESVLLFLPILLGPVLVISVYYLTRSAYPTNKEIALIASGITAISHQIIVGFYAGFYANWLALVMIYFSSAFLLKSLREDSSKKRNISLFAVFNLTALLFHSYTWSFFVLVNVFFLIWSGILAKMKGQSVLTISILAIIILGIFSVDQIKSQLTSTNDSFENDLSVVSVGTSEFEKRWTNLNFTFSSELGGFLTNSGILILLLIWTIKANYSSNSDRFFLSIIFVSLLPILLGNFVLQSRIFYNIPFQIPASLVASRLLSHPQSKVRTLLLCTFVLMQANYAMRAMANMYFMPPT